MSPETDELISYSEEAPFGRRLFSLSIPALDAFPQKLELPSPHFILLLACDATFVATSTISDFVEATIDHGVAYFCAWGPDCERVHDIFDEVLVQREIAGNAAAQIMTTWHTHEDLDETIWYMLHSAYPDKALAETCRVDLAVSVANVEWDEHIRRSLSELDKLNERVA